MSIPVNPQMEAAEALLLLHASRKRSAIDIEVPRQSKRMRIEKLDTPARVHKEALKLQQEAIKSGADKDQAFICTFHQPHLIIATSTEFSYHMRTQHPNDKSGCWFPECSREFKEPKGLTKHVREQHWGRTNKYICGECAQIGVLNASIRSSHVSEHLESIHNNVAVEESVRKPHRYHRLEIGRLTYIFKNQPSADFLELSQQS